jgi:YggT family protein
VGGYFTNALGFLIHVVFGMAILIVMLRFILQLMRADFYNPLSQFIVKATQPVLVPMRRVIPGAGGVDVSSIVLLLGLQSLELIIGKLMGFGIAPRLSFAGLPVWALAELIELALFVFIITLIIRVVMSWFNLGSTNPMTNLLYSINEPLLRPARRLLPPFSGMDFSPLAVLVALNLAQILIVAPIRDAALSL